jgi:hypothetical protein
MIQSIPISAQFFVSPPRGSSAKVDLRAQLPQKTPRSEHRSRRRKTRVLPSSSAFSVTAGLILAANNPIIALDDVQPNQRENLRMHVIRQARKSKRSAQALQRRVSLIGQGKWRMMNLAEVAGSATKWV